MKISTFTAPRLAVWTFNVLFNVRTWKLIGTGVVLASLWYSIHTFINTYNIVWSNGIYGIVTESKNHEIVTAGMEIQLANDSLNQANYQLQAFREIRDLENSDVTGGVQ